LYGASELRSRCPIEHLTWSAIFCICVFYPGDWEHVSRQQLVLYQEYLPELYRFGATLIGILTDSVWSPRRSGERSV
jgi:peroxiredoxin